MLLRGRGTVGRREFDLVGRKQGGRGREAGKEKEGEIMQWRERQTHLGK